MNKIFVLIYIVIFLSNSVCGKKYKDLQDLVDNELGDVIEDIEDGSANHSIRSDYIFGDIFDYDPGADVSVDTCKCFC